MLSISKPMTGDNAQQYFSRDDYYLEEKGTWHGKGAKSLRLSGTIQQEDFKNITAGYSPAGLSLVQNGAGENKHRAGVDLTFSASKSVSILALTDDRIRGKHNLAVSKTLDYIEKYYAQARITQNGETRPVETENLVIAKFPHFTSRNLDPQLHTHSFVANMTKRQDGKWAAVHNDNFYLNQKLFGQYYRSVLSFEINQLGYQTEISDPREGFFEIKGVSEKLIDEFSGRRKAVVGLAEKWISEGKFSYLSKFKLYEKAAIESRVKKSNSITKEVLNESWATSAKEQGTSLKQERDFALQEGQSFKKRKKATLPAKEYVLHALHAINDREAVFTREALLKESLMLSLTNHPPEEIAKAITLLIKNRQITKLAKNHFTTPEMEKIEKGIIQKVKAGTLKEEKIIEGKRFDEIIDKKYSHLTLGQRNAAKHILTTKDKIIGIQGDSGTGKTTMLDVANTLLKEEGFEVRGLAFTGKAAEEIESSAGIKSQTLHSFLGKPCTSSQKKQIWIVDEASTVGSRQMENIIDLAEEKKARLVFIGDKKQLQPLEAGKMFSVLQERGTLETAYMEEVVRQRPQNYKNIVVDVSQKRIARAFERLDKENSIHEIKRPERMISEVVQEYVSGKYQNTLLVTQKNESRSVFNSLIRKNLKKRSVLGEKEWTVNTQKALPLKGIQKILTQNYQPGNIISIVKPGAGIKVGTQGTIVKTSQDTNSITIKTAKGKLRELNLMEHGEKVSAFEEEKKAFSQNEKIVFSKNSNILKVKNNTSGIIRSINDFGDIKVELENSRIVSFNTRDYAHFDYGYAVTDYKAQGQTSKKVIFHAPADNGTGKTSHNSFYVGISRGKQNALVFTDDIEVLKEQVKKEQKKTSTLDFEKTSTEKPKNIFYPVSIFQKGDLHKTKRKEIGEKGGTDLDFPNSEKVRDDNGRSLER